MSASPYRYAGEGRAIADFSGCGRFRYSLQFRLRDQGPRVAVILLHPMLGDVDHKDAETEKVLAIGRALGWGTIEIGGLFARRTKVSGGALNTAADPVGPSNDAALRSMMASADLVVAAWGEVWNARRRIRDRWPEAVRIAAEAGAPLYCLGLDRDRHPLRALVARAVTPEPWSVPDDD